MWFFVFQSIFCATVLSWMLIVLIYLLIIINRIKKPTYTRYSVYQKNLRKLFKLVIMINFVLIYLDLYCLLYSDSIRDIFCFSVCNIALNILITIPYLI